MWRLGSQYDVAGTRGADRVLASDCRAQVGRLSTRRGCRICVTVRLPVRLRSETMYWQANANSPLSVTPLLNVPDNGVTLGMQAVFLRFTIHNDQSTQPASRQYLPHQVRCKNLETAPNQKVYHRGPITYMSASFWELGLHPVTISNSTSDFLANSSGISHVSTPH